MPASIRASALLLAVAAAVLGTASHGARPDDPHHATGRTDVKAFVPKAFDEPADGSALVEIQLSETFSGDIVGEGTARAIEASRKDGSATLVGLERVRGSIAGRQGTFLLQVSATVVDKQMRARWSVVPGSGTGDLRGLRGDGGFQAQLGAHGSVWLDYSFE
jgi:hypothetical protein